MGPKMEIPQQRSSCAADSVTRTPTGQDSGRNGSACRAPLHGVRQALLRPFKYVYSTVTDLARFLGWSTLQPRITAMW